MAASSSSSTSEKKKMIVLLSKEGQTFEVEEATALLSQTVKNMIEDDCTDGGIPLPNVDSKTLAKVIEFCNRHAAPAPPENDADTLKTFDSDYVASIKDDHPVLFDLILAANYLNIKILLDLTCQTVADMIKGKSPKEIRETFNIKNDFTKEEEEEIKRENAWAFE